MDDIVRQAIAKWPHVPHCFGWLGLGMRGQWFLRDDQVQAQGPFAADGAGTPRSKGALLEHDKLIAFIGRNYETDATGQWFFQNGPQRVYVELEAAPWVWRLTPTAGRLQVRTHTGRDVDVQGCVLDEQGRLYLHTPLGLGIVHTQDVLLAAQAIEAGEWEPQEIPAADLPSRFGFVRSPQARPSRQAGP